MSDVPDGLTEALSDRYAIERKLGEGGMASVYLAEDIKHERKVALKVLKPELAAVIGGERFVTEIKTTAGLQHPHILPLFDSGEADGFLYYVMPFIDGETLRDRLDAERQLPVEEALNITRACAGALDYAHRQGVIHRDIKPENILLQDGNPVVGDFGIALAISAAGGGRLTETGLSLGTPHYMSPEQATADRDLTSRSDVYSLGAVLYEMLAGDPPHTGPSAQAILMRILTEDPRPITDTRRSVPPNVAAAVAKSLEKLPADRFESAAAFSDALDDRGFEYTAPQRATTAPSGVPAPAGGSASGSWLTDIRSVAALALLVVTIAALGFSLRGERGGAEAGAVVRAPFYVDDFTTIAISHDGTMVAYFDSEGLWLQHLDEAEPQRLAEETGIGFAAFSPDDQWVAYTASSDETLKRVPVGGGSSITITDLATGGFTPFWGDDGRIVYTSMDGTYVVPWTGEGEPERVLTGSVLFQRSARFLPGSTALIYTQQTMGTQTGSTRLLHLESGEDRLLIEDGVDARYIPTGHLLFGRASQSIFAVPFDIDRLEIAGSEVAVLDSVGVGSFVGLVNFSVSETGTAIYGYESMSGTIGGDGGTDEIVFVEDGVSTPVGLPRGSNLAGVRASPDGRYLAYQEATQAFVFDVIVGTNIPLSAGVPLFAPIWRPDGESVDGVGLASGLSIVNVVPRSTDLPTAFARPPAGYSVLVPLDWTRDGQTLLLQTVAGQDETDLWTMAAGDSVPERFLDSDWDEEAGDLSPDDAWVAYVSDLEGEKAVFVRSFPVPGAVVRVSPGRGTYPRWSPDGDQIYFRARDSVFAANVVTGDGFAVESVEFLFTGDYNSDFDVMPDGRLVMVRNIQPDAPDEPAEPESSEEEDAGPRAFIVVNWFEEMKARLGGGGK